MNTDLVNNILNNKQKIGIDNFDLINNKISVIINEAYKPYELFKKNVLNKENSLNILMNKYQFYCPSDVCLVSGDYIRYISKKNKLGNNIVIKLGGFLLDESDTFVRIINKNRVMRISKKDNYIFRKLTNNDIFRISISNNI